MAEITFVLHPNLALAGRIDAGDQVQERRLARAAGPHQPQELARGHFQREVLEDVDALAAAAERTCGRVRRGQSAWQVAS